MTYMAHFKKWVPGSRMMMLMAMIMILCTAMNGFSQCIDPGAPVNFTATGNTTTAGYTTTYVLTDYAGNIVQSPVTSGFASPATAGTYKVYAVNYATGAGNTAPTLSVGTNIGGIGGTCAAVSTTPVEFCVKAACITPGSAISFAIAGNTGTAGYTTTYVLTDNAGVIISSHAASPITAPATAGSYKVYAVNYSTTGGNAAPTLTAGTNITAIGGGCANVSTTPLEICVAAAAVPDLTPNITLTLPNVIGVTATTLMLRAIEIKNAPTVGTITLNLRTNSAFTLGLTAGAVINGWTYAGIVGLNYKFTSAVVLANSFSEFAVPITFNPQGGTGSYTFTLSIPTGSGGEVNNANNSDQETMSFEP